MPVLLPLFYSRRGAGDRDIALHVHRLGGGNDMTDVSDIARGFVLGLSIAAPVGPIGVLCIRRTLAHGRAVGFVSGLGAATADATYGAVAGFGLTAMTRVLTSSASWLHLGGGFFLLWLGIMTFRTAPSEGAAETPGRGLLASYLSTLALTLANPTTIFSFVAIFAGIGVATTNGASTALLVAGVFSGSAFWWFLLSGATALFRGKMTPDRLAIVNKFSGAVIGTFGALALLSVAAGLLQPR